MATIRIVNENSDTSVTINGYVAKEKELLKSLEGYCFYRGGVSNHTRANEYDFFDEKAHIIAVQQVNGGNTLKGSLVGFILGGFIGLGIGFVWGLRKDLKRPKLGDTKTSPNNSLGDRGNEVRLGERIEDIWGTHPKVYPSLLSSYTRFNNDFREVECSTLSLGRGKYNTQRYQDNDYNCDQIPTMKLAEYNPGTVISGTPDKIVTNTAPEYPPLLTKQVGNIASFELRNESTGKFLLAQKDYIGEDGDIVVAYTARRTPYFTTQSEVVIEANARYTKTIRLTGCGVSDWTTTLFIDGGNLSFEGLAYAEEGVAAVFDNCSVISASITGVVAGYMEFVVTYNTSSARDTFWDKLPVGVAKSPIYSRYDVYKSGDPEYPEEITYFVLNQPRPPGLGYSDSTGYNVETILFENEVKITLTSSYQSERIYIDYQSNGTASYLSNFVCDKGTAGGNNVAVLTITYDDNSTTKETFSCPKYTKDTSMRVGYTHTKSFLQSASPKPVYFTWHRSDTSGNSFVLRDVYRYEDLTGFKNDDVTIARVERQYSDYFGASNEMKLSCKATRVVQTITENVDGTWQLSGTETGTLGVADRLDIVIANLHLDAYNGRRTTTTLDYASLKAAVDSIEEFIDVTCGISFDDDSLKYEDELKALLIPFGIQVYQLGSKLYFLAEKSQTSADMLFTHRDYDVSSFKMSYIFRDNDNYDGVKLSYKTSEEISGYYGDDYEIGDTIELFLPQDATISNPLEIELNAVHTEQQANLTLYREYYKQKYAKKSIQFTAFAMGRQVVPGMVIAVADNLRKNKSDGEILSTYVDGGYTYAETSQILPNTFNFVAITNEDGSVSYYSVTRDSDYVFRFNNTPTGIYTDWEQSKTRYMVYQSDYAKYLVTDVDVKGAAEVEISAINYDNRYYQKDSSFTIYKQGNVQAFSGSTNNWTFYTSTLLDAGSWIAKVYTPDGTVFSGAATTAGGGLSFNFTGFFDYNGTETLTYELYYR